MKLSKIIKNFELFYPKHLAYEWDNVGLQIGDLNKDIKTVLTVLEVTEDVVDEAIEKDIDLIVCHHPLIFKDLKAITANKSHTNKIITLIKNDICVYAAHTNVDIATNGVNDWLASVLEIERPKILQKETFDKYLYITIEVAKEDIKDVNNLLSSFSDERDDVLQKVSIVPSSSLSKDANYQNSKYNISGFILETEIPALKNLMRKYNLEHKHNKIFYSAINTLNMKKDYGIGRIGAIKPKTLEMLANQIKEKFDIDGVKIVGSRETIISRVAIVGGSGGNYIDAAIAKKADVLITGDTGYHQAQHALENNICLIDAGHHLEIIFNDIMSDFIALITDCVVLPSEIDSNPYEVI